MSRHDTEKASSFPVIKQRHFSFSANLKAMTMTRAKMAPCMNRWPMQP